MRSATQTRTTKETNIQLTVCLDGGNIAVNTGIGFFDHMLTAFAMHGNFGLEASVQGDLHVDCHHTVEDTGIVLGKAFAQALGDKSGIARFGNFFVPMDEALAFCAVDVSGRAFLGFTGEFAQAQVGDYESCMTEEFFRAFCTQAGITMHLKLEYGKNTHHATEALFKAAAHALRLACTQSGTQVLSTKGVL